MKHSKFKSCLRNKPFAVYCVCNNYYLKYSLNNDHINKNDHLNKKATIVFIIRTISLSLCSIYVKVFWSRTVTRLSLTDDFIKVSINFFHNLSDSLSLSTSNSTIEIKSRLKLTDIDKTNHKSLNNPSRGNSGAHHLQDIWIVAISKFHIRESTGEHLIIEISRWYLYHLRSPTFPRHFPKFNHPLELFAKSGSTSFRCRWFPQRGSPVRRTPYRSILLFLYKL